MSYRFPEDTLGFDSKSIATIDRVRKRLKQPTYNISIKFVKEFTHLRFEVLLLFVLNMSWTCVLCAINSSCIKQLDFSVERYNTNKYEAFTY